MTAIEGRGLWRTYRNEGAPVDALRGVEITVETGEFVSIMGQSGSGKSTLLHLLGGLDTPSDGDVILEGRTLAGLSRTELAAVRNRRVGFVFQLFNLVPSLTVEENVALPAAIAGVYDRTRRRRVAELLALVGLTDQRDRIPTRLSGGEQQRVAVARALLMEPAVLLADEPTGNLDSANGEAVMALLRDCHRDGQTIVLVTHDLKVAAQAQRLITMRDGQIIDETTLNPTSAGVSTLVRVDNDVVAQ